MTTLKLIYVFILLAVGFHILRDLPRLGLEDMQVKAAIQKAGAR